MLKGLFTSLALLSVSCSSQVDLGSTLPMWGNEAQQICYANCPEPKSTALAIILTDRILQDWGLEHTKVFESVTVTWNPVDPDHPNLAGTSPDIGEVDLYDVTPGDVQGSALGHELIHQALVEQTGDWDYDHTDILFDMNDGYLSAEQDIREAIIEHGI